MSRARRRGRDQALRAPVLPAGHGAAQLTAIDKDWDCPWPLDWQRHYRVLADLVDADSVLPHIAPGVVFDGDDVGKWLQQQRQPGIWARLLPEQQERLTTLGVQPDQKLSLTPAAGRTAKAPSKAQQAFQRGLAALTQWAEREGAHRPVPRAHGEEISVEGEAEPVTVKLGVWVSNTKSRRDKLTADQLARPRETRRGLGVGERVGSGCGARPFTFSSGAVRRAGG